MHRNMNLVLEQPGSKPMYHYTMTTKITQDGILRGKITIMLKFKELSKIF